MISWIKIVNFPSFRLFSPFHVRKSLNLYNNFLLQFHSIMDIKELLSYKPVQTPKRHLTGEELLTPREDADYERKRKHRKITENKTKAMEEAVAKAKREAELQLHQQREREAREKAEEEEKQKSMIEKLLEEEPEGSEDHVLDEVTLKKMLLLFEKRSLKNREMRIKFSEQPEKFMESELELHETIQEMHALATVPDLYPIMVQLQAIPSILELLLHENTDISVAIVDLLKELTDADILGESEEGAEVLLTALLKNDLCSLLVQNLERLDETVKEENEGVFNTLSVFENIVESVLGGEADIGKQGLIAWLLKRLKAKIPFDTNKLYASEILSILIQNGGNDNRSLFGDLDGVDVLLQQLAYYKRHDPSTKEEKELMENLFLCLCSSLLTRENRDRFLKGEGLQLMNLMLKEKKLSRNGALRVLDHAMSGQYGGDNCQKFVEILGLRTLFPLFMHTPKKHKRRTLSMEEHEEHVLSIVASMTKHCRGPQRLRLLNKFMENDFEKVDRLLELHFKYLDKVEAVDRRVELTRASKRDNEEEETDEDIYLKRLEGGLYTLQLIDYILLEMGTCGQASVKHRLVQILSSRKESLKTIKRIMREYAGNFGNDGSSEWKTEQVNHILYLIDKF